MKDNKSFERLPKWAQDRISLLERNLSDLKATMQSVSELNTNVRWERGMDEAVGIPSRARVIFTLKSGNVECYSSDGTVLDIRSTSGKVIVEPWSSNAIHIRTEER